jgi:uncharacterized protein
MKIVLDTNVLVSGLLNPEGLPAKIINMLVNERLTIFYDNRILQEYKDVLGRSKFGFTADLIDPLIDFIRQTGQFVTADHIVEHFDDEDDKKFLEVAESADADFLITGNKVHFPDRPGIVTPREFIENLDKIAFKLP